jgi:hypothetical protein
MSFRGAALAGTAVVCAAERVGADTAAVRAAGPRALSLLAQHTAQRSRTDPAVSQQHTTHNPGSYWMLIHAWL